MRDVVETVVSHYMEVPNTWKNNRIPRDFHNYYMFDCHRTFQYGYSEYDYCYIYFNTSMVDVPEDTEELMKTKINIPVYDVEIACPCGCGAKLHGSGEFVDECDDEEGYVYNGSGFLADNMWYQEGYEYEPDPLWCNYCDGNCERGLIEDDECWGEECSVWSKFNPVCGLDNEERCEIDPDDDEPIEVKDEVTIPCEHHCESCWIWKQKHPDDEDGEDR